MEADIRIAARRVTDTNPVPVAVVSGGGGGAGDASAANQTTQIAQLGDHLTDAPGSYSVLGRLRSMMVSLTTLVTATGEVQASPTANTILSRLKAIGDKLPTLGAQASAASLSVTPATGASFAVAGPLTDTQLRAAAVPVSGPLTDAQLRATAVPMSGTVTANIGTAGTLALEATQAALAAKLPATIGQKAMASSLAVVLASDQSAIPVAATAGQVFFEGTATITRPAGALTYTAGNALHSAASGSAATVVTLNNPTTAAAIAAGSVIVITGIQVHAATASPTVLPLFDILLSPVTFTTVGDNAAFVPPTARLQDGIIVTTDFGLLCGASGALGWNYDSAARLKLAAGSSALYFQPRFRLAYAASGAEAFVFRISGYVVQ